MNGTGETASSRLRPSRVVTAFTLARLVGPYATFSVLKHVVPAAVLARWAWTDGRVGHSRDGVREQRIVAAVVRLRRLCGSDRGDCLEAGLVLYRELARLGVDPTLVMGFSRDATHVAGHAWVEVDGTVVGETSEGLQRFVPTVRFGPNGRRLE